MKKLQHIDRETAFYIAQTRLRRADQAFERSETRYLNAINSDRANKGKEPFTSLLDMSFGDYDDDCPSIRQAKESFVSSGMRHERLSNQVKRMEKRLFAKQERTN